jgi:3-dehydroquinate synthase
MPPARPTRIVLIGFSATGKSAVARALADRLGWTARDTDDLIEQRAGRSVPDIFARDGEAAFRALERDAARQAAAQERAVIATGGGLWLDAANREALCDGGFVVALEARPGTIVARHADAESARPDARPLLAGGDRLETVRRLKAARQSLYALADATVHTDAASVEQVVDQIVAAFERDGAAAVASAERRRDLVRGPTAAEPDAAPSESRPAAHDALAAVVRTRPAAADYPVYCAWGLLERLPEILDHVAPAAGRVFLVCDAAVQPLYGAAVTAALTASGRRTESTTAPGGETSKNPEQLQTLFDWLAGARAERGDVVLALGGGVVTDLAGTAAATYLRGMPLVHAPTTLLGMVDAAIGGKVAIDLPAGKNLVGAFYQPRAVVADIATLATLPPRELRAGFAEVIKHAFIRDPAMLDELERDAASLLALNDSAPAVRDRAVSLIARNMAIKAAVVSADERESDLRMTLNYGHTIGHAIEAVTSYEACLHGEAVAIGLVGAARIAQGVGLIDGATVARHERILERFGLPTRATPGPGLTTDAVIEAMRSDKKVAAGRQRWVLLEAIGAPVVRDDVPPALVREVVLGLVEPAAT